MLASYAPVGESVNNLQKYPLVLRSSSCQIEMQLIDSSMVEHVVRHLQPPKNVLVCSYRVE